jgi:hypothetical protein
MPAGANVSPSADLGVCLLSVPLELSPLIARFFSTLSTDAAQEWSGRHRTLQAKAKERKKRKKNEKNASMPQQSQPRPHLLGLPDYER